MTITTSSLLLELFVEELPPKALKKLGDAFSGVLFEQLKTQGLCTADSQLTAFASPRRLAAHITAVLRKRRTSHLAKADAGGRGSGCCRPCHARLAEKTASPGR
jgi:glycyl-tRNA synthetase beta subunit